MLLKVLKHLQDILEAINNIESFVGKKKYFNRYRNNKLLKSAVERQLSIIGEALNRVKHDDSTFQISSSKSIIGLRNRVIHAYDAVDDVIIWGVIINHLPKIKAEVTELLKSYKKKIVLWKK